MTVQRNMGGHDITFETKCWERDWKIMLTTGRLQRMVDACDYAFSQRVLYINNVRDRGVVCRHADRLVQRGVIDCYCCVEDYADEALAHFRIEKDSFAGGYVYSIQELVGIYRCSSKYLLHFSGDSMMSGGGAWITPAIERMESDPKIKVANPSWKASLDEARAESHTEEGEFFRGFGFSDQCYLIRAADFKGQIYGEKHDASQRYPRYGGELFEKRVDAYMRNHGFERLTSKRAWYLHRNVPSDVFRRWILLRFGMHLKK